MSANLLNGVSPSLLSGTTESEGTYHHAAFEGKIDILAWSLSGQKALAANQTVHLGLSLRGASADASDLHMVVAYVDGAGNRNWAWGEAMPVGTSWGRAEATVVIPSGMTMTWLTVSTRETAKVPEVWMTAPTLSLGSAVCLASSAHTPYATQDHLRSEYATKAALKVTSDAVTAEVEERGKLAGRVGTLESTSGTHTSKLEQLATSIKSLVKGESTYTDPDGKSATSGIYSLVTQTRDSVTALFGSYTKTADLASTQAVKDAKKAGTDAQAAASAAQTTADTAKANAATAVSTAKTAASDAATAKTNASSAVSTANAASGTASKASKDAAAAVKTANAASSNASSAVSTANGAVSTANAASSTAQTAKSTADTAKSTADSANAAAGSAQSTADTAVADAAKAQSSADAAQSTADTAKANAATAQSTANAAKGTADSLATMIREDATGITVGKSADGKTYSTGRTHMDEDSFDVLDKAGNVLSSFGEKLIELGKNSQDATISMLGGLMSIGARKSSNATVATLSSERVSVDGSREAFVRAGAHSDGNVYKGYSALLADSTGGVGTLRLYATSGNGTTVVRSNSLTASPSGYDLSHPEYLLAALLGTGGTDSVAVSHGSEGVTTTPDLDACGPGVWSYNDSTANRPTDYGTCVCIRAGGGNWLFQLALPTVGDPYWRRNINGAGWEGWWVIKSQ